jgi:hypothetical protein
MSTSIKWPGAAQATQTQAEASAAGGGVSAAARRQETADPRGRAVLATALDRALTRLQERIDSLAWPASWQSFPSSKLATSRTSELDASVTDQDAAAGAHSVRVSASAQNSIYATGGFDPNAQTTLAPGRYTLDWSVGADTSPTASGQAVLVVQSGDTWGDVLARMARVFGSASPAMASRLVPARRVWDSTDGNRRELVEAAGVEIASTTPGAAGRLRLSGADADAEALLDALGLSATARPGADARAVVDGVAQTSATGEFTADGGRVKLAATGSFGEVEQVRVSGAAESLADGLAGVLAAYNEVLALLKGGAVRAGVAEDWTRPAEERAAELNGLGVERSSGGALWLDGGRLLSSLFAAPERTQQALAGADGLLPELAAKTRQALEGGTAELLAPVETGLAADPALKVFAARRETEAEYERGLLNLYDAAANENNSDGEKILERSGWTGVLHLKG